LEKEQIDEIAERLREYIGALDGMGDQDLSLEQVKSIMAAEKIFASGQDVEEFEPDDIEAFTSPITTVTNPLVQQSGSNYPASPQLGGIAGKPNPLLSARSAFMQGLSSSGLQKKYGLHTIEVESVFDKDSIRFCCMTPSRNRVCAQVDRIDLMKEFDPMKGLKIAVTSALIEIEGYLKHNPGV
jgi:hypothetical protein